MPELPEMRGLAERLTESFAGAPLAGITPYGFSALKTVTPEPSSLMGEHLQDVGRRGKYLLWRFDAATIAVRLSQGGRLDIEVPAKQTKPRGSVAATQTTSSMPRNFRPSLPSMRCRPRRVSGCSPACTRFWLRRSRVSVRARAAFRPNWARGSPCMAKPGSRVRVAGTRWPV